MNAGALQRKKGARTNVERTQRAGTCETGETKVASCDIEGNQREPKMTHDADEVENGRRGQNAGATAPSPRLRCNASAD